MFPLFIFSIGYYFGHNAVRMLKLWIKYRKVIIKNSVKVEFLHKYISHNIAPSHLGSFLMNFHKNLNYQRSINAFQLFKTHLIRKLLQIEIRDAYCDTRFAHAHVFKLCRAIYCYLLVSVCNPFFLRQEGPLHSFFIPERGRLDRKFNFLFRKHKTENNTIRPIRYYCSLPHHDLNSDNVSNSRFSFQLTISFSNTLNNEIEIEIVPNSFKIP